MNVYNYKTGFKFGFWQSFSCVNRSVWKDKFWIWGVHQTFSWTLVFGLDKEVIVVWKFSDANNFGLRETISHRTGKKTFVGLGLIVIITGLIGSEFFLDIFGFACNCFWLEQSLVHLVMFRLQSFLPQREVHIGQRRSGNVEQIVSGTLKVSLRLLKMRNKNGRKLKTFELKTFEGETENGRKVIEKSVLKRKRRDLKP